MSTSLLININRSLQGSAAEPSAGTTNLHLDMSDALNVMVSFNIVRHSVQSV